MGTEETGGSCTLPPSLTRTLLPGPPPVRRGKKPESTSCQCGSVAGFASTAVCTFYVAAAANPGRLLAFDDAPRVLQFNRYIRSSYRAGLTPAACLRSVFQLHNETGAIWSHLLPALGMLTSVTVGGWAPWPHAAMAWRFNVYSILACFLASACYHTFLAHHHHYDMLLKIDVCGVLLVIVGE